MKEVSIPKKLARDLAELLVSQAVEIDGELNCRDGIELIASGNMKKPFYDFLRILGDHDIGYAAVPCFIDDKAFFVGDRANVK